MNTEKSIGDEKVVAEVGEVFDLRWIGSGPLAPLVNKHGVRVGDKLVPLKAYAELAAERDAFREQSEQLRESLGFATDERRKLDTQRLTAESQLAKLRGKVEGLADMFDAISKSNDSKGGEHHSGKALAYETCANELRTLAAADGGKS